MAVLLTPFFLQFTDNTGAPLKNGFVATYAAGTVSTPKATYTDFTETVQLPNPVPLDDAGRATIWISGSYKFVLTDALGNIIKTTDNVTSFNVPAASANSFFQSFSGNGTQTVFNLSADLGVDPKALLVFVDQGAGKGYDVANPNTLTLTSGVTPSLTIATPPASGTNNVFVFCPSLLLGAASSAAAQAASSATQAAASAVTAAAASLSGTSSTSVPIATGSKTFVTQTGKNYTPGAMLLLASTANVANYFFGQITAYNTVTGSLTVNVTTTGGSGTFADWIINVAGVQGVAGGSVANGTYGRIVVTGGGTVWNLNNMPIFFAVSDEATALTTGTTKLSFRSPVAMTINAGAAGIHLSAATAPTGAALIVDVKKNGTSLFSTKPQIDIGATTSVGSAVTPIFASTSIAVDDLITVDISQVGSTVAGAGLKGAILGTI